MNFLRKFSHLTTSSLILMFSTIFANIFSRLNQVWVVDDIFLYFRVETLDDWDKDFRMTDRLRCS